MENNRKRDNYSVLLSVHQGENPAYFTAAIQSMLDQTVVTDDFVIVCDGPVTRELDGVLEMFEARYPGLFRIVRLPENVGVGLAARAGLAQCRNEFIAKMDSDDIAVPNRCFSALATARLLRRIEAFRTDVIHLHNLHGWFIHLPMLFSWLKKHDIPVVWTLHRAAVLVAGGAGGGILPGQLSCPGDP